MEIEIDSKRNNPLLNRTEIYFTIKHEGEGTPNRELIRSELADKLNVKKENIIVNTIDSSFGKQEISGYAKIYSSIAKAKDLERDHLLKRNRIIEGGKQAEKKTEETPSAPKEEEKPAEPAAEIKPEAAGEVKTEEPIKEEASTPEPPKEEEKPAEPAPDVEPKPTEEVKAEEPPKEEAPVSEPPKEEPADQEVKQEDKPEEEKQKDKPKDESTENEQTKEEKKG